MMNLTQPSASVSSVPKYIMAHAAASKRSSGSIQEKGQSDDNAMINVPLLPQQAQARLHQSPSFRKAVLSFEGHNSHDLIERAIELDYIARARCRNTCPLLPQQALQRLDQSPGFRKAALSFKGHDSESLIERAIQMEYMARLRKCVKDNNFSYEE
mmetsp:Transcript_32832/g.49523  ORF Transcript_32832/g.49523 Transcript_32832/m.49523 type:complete len:156 (-) Transcript_32832:73-540(-)